MFKTLILIALSINMAMSVAFAKGRFTEDEKKAFMEEVTKGITEHKNSNKGQIDFQILKPFLYEELDKYHQARKFSREELIIIKQNYENFSAATNGDATQKEKAFVNFVGGQLEGLSSTPIRKSKENNLCNKLDCEDGLKCAVDPHQGDGKQCKGESKICTNDTQCCSGSCIFDKSEIKDKAVGTCDLVRRCFRPQELGSACINNPLCAQGECSNVDFNTSGIFNTCTDRGYQCKKSSECCSGSCERGRCVENKICKDCVKQGLVPQRGQTCCEGYIQLESGGACQPDIPPVVPNQVNNSKKLLNLVAEFFISSANAQDENQAIPDTLRARQLAIEIAAKVKAKSPSVEDISAAMETYNASAEDIEKLKELAAKDPAFQKIYDNAVAKEKAEEDKEAARLQQIQKDNSDMTGEILSNQDKYSNFQAESVTEEPVKVKKVDVKLTRKSDFDKCEIRFRDDFTNYLQASNLLDLDIALLAFDYVMLGDGVNDYFTVSGDQNSSLYGRLKSVASQHKDLRKNVNTNLDKMNERLTCMCLDVKGYKSITDATKKTWFETTCPEYEKYKNPAMSYDEIEGDASGVKAKRLIVFETKAMEDFNAGLTVDYTKIYQGVANINQWSQSTPKWNEVENRKYTLFNFNIKNPSGSVAALGAILGALLAAGVIAILGGFASTSILTAWAAAGIIATSAITGGTGLWLIASLKGAWITKRPEIFDKYIRSYGCGKKETCVEYSRELNQPYNKVCNVHTSANACIKNFVVYYKDDEPRYVVDPWIPVGVSKSLVLRDAADKPYAQRLEDGFIQAKNSMVAKNPGATGGGGKDGGQFVSEDYLRNLFIDANILGDYTPKIGTDATKYILNDNIIKEIKDKAKEYAISEKLFEAGDKENLNNFAEYVYQYHFLWPKTSRLKEISYPTMGMNAYLDLMSNGVVANMAAGAGGATNTFRDLHKKHLEDYLKTLELYSGTINQKDPIKKQLITADIDAAKKELEGIDNLNALLGSNTFSSNLGNMGNASLSGIAGKGGLSSLQSNFANAIGTLRNARKEQLKKLSAYNKAMSGNKERASRVAAATKKFKQAFTNPTSSSSKSFGGGNGGYSSTDAAKENADENLEAANKNFGGTGANFDPGIGAGSGTSSAIYGKGKATDENAAGEGAYAGGMSDEDRKKLQEAIDARNRASKEKYSSNKDKTIFEQVTNAYIRNYDKVLIKKKSDKDVEQK